MKSRERAVGLRPRCPSCVCGQNHDVIYGQYLEHRSLPRVGYHAEENHSKHLRARLDPSSEVFTHACTGIH